MSELKAVPTSSSAHSSLKDVAHAASNTLFDVLALIDGASELASRMEHDCQDDTAQFVIRLLQQAEKKIRGIQTEMDPHI